MAGWADAAADSKLMKKSGAKRTTKSYHEPVEAEKESGRDVMMLRESATINRATLTPMS